MTAGYHARRAGSRLPWPAASRGRSSRARQGLEQEADLCEPAEGGEDLVALCLVAHQGDELEALVAAGGARPQVPQTVLQRADDPWQGCAHGLFPRADDAVAPGAGIADLGPPADRLHAHQGIRPPGRAMIPHARI